MGIFSFRCLAFATSVCLSLSAFSQQTFDETNTGIDTKFGGISDSELQARDQDFNTFFNRFKQGRASTTKLKELGLSEGRMSGILEVHDLDFDGRTDHSLSYAALEKTIEEAVVKKNDLQGTAWDKAHEEVRTKTIECKKPGRNKDCQNISSVIVTYAVAHNHDFHKVYTVAEKVASAVSAAGESYAEQVFIDATAQSRTEALGRRPVPANVRYKKGAAGQGQFVYTNPEGESRTVDIQPSIDALRAEASWIMQQIENNLLTGAQTIKAGRLAGIEVTGGSNNSKQLQEFGRMLSKDPTNVKEVSRRIAEKVVYGGQSICSGSYKIPTSSNPCDTQDRTFIEALGITDQTPADKKFNEQSLVSAARKKFPGLSDDKVLQLIKETSSISPDKNGDYTLGDINSLNGLNTVKLNAYASASSAQKAEELYKKARNALQNDSETKKSLSEKITKIEKCMSADSVKSGKWCNGPDLKTVGSKDFEAFEEVKGDPGAFFKDTRELTYASAYRASIGPASSFLSSMTHGDFNASNGGEIYNKMKDSYEKSMKSVQEFKAGVNRAIAATRAQGINVTDSFNSNYNADTMNFKQLGQRNTDRDAVFMADRGVKSAIEDQARQGQSGPSVTGSYSGTKTSITTPNQGASRFQSDASPYSRPDIGPQ